MRSHLWVCLSVLVALRAGSLSGQTRGAPAASQAIRTVVATLDTAWGAADADRWTSMFWPDAEFVNVSGLIFSGSNEIRARHEAIWHAHFRGSHAQGTIRRLVFLSPDVAIADVNFAVRDYAYLPAMGARETEPGVVLSRMRHVLTRRDGRWRIAATQNTLVAPKQ